jgi:hypothetical protein
MLSAAHESVSVEGFGCRCCRRKSAEDINGPSSVAIRGQSLTQLRHEQERFAATHKRRCARSGPRDDDTVSCVEVLLPAIAFNAI